MGVLVTGAGIAVSRLLLGRRYVTTVDKKDTSGAIAQSVTMKVVALVVMTGLRQAKEARGL